MNLNWSSFPLFRGLDFLQIKEIIKKNVFRKTFFKKGNYLFLQGSQCEYLPLLAKGHCVGEMTDLKGHIIKMEEFKAPYVIASGLIFSKNFRFPVSVKALNDGFYYKINKNDLLNLLAEYPVLMENFIKDISQKLVFLTERLHFMSFYEGKQKLSCYLLEKSIKQNFIKIQNIEQLANYLGMARQSLYREFQALSDIGAIEKKGRVIRIIDKEKLHNLSTE